MASCIHDLVQIRDLLFDSNAQLDVFGPTGSPRHREHGYLSPGTLATPGLVYPERIYPDPPLPDADGESYAAAYERGRLDTYDAAHSPGPSMRYRDDTCDRSRDYTALEYVGSPSHVTVNSAIKAEQDTWGKLMSAVNPFDPYPFHQRSGEHSGHGARGAHRSTSPVSKRKDSPGATSELPTGGTRASEHGMHLQVASHAEERHTSSQMSLAVRSPLRHLRVRGRLHARPPLDLWHTCAQASKQTPLFAHSCELAYACTAVCALCHELVFYLTPATERCRCRNPSGDGWGCPPRCHGGGSDVCFATHQGCR